MAALSTPPRTPPPPTSTNFDIVSHYNVLISSDPSLTPPIAAIESLISLLSSCQVQTVSETLSLLSSASATLLASQSNPLPISAGTELFQRYLITSFNQTPLSSRSGSDFSALRNQQITNSKLFVARAKQARGKIATYALPLFGPDHETENKSTVITYGGSRVVSEVLRHAADKGRWFNVIHIVPSSTKTSGSTSREDKTSSQISGLKKEMGVKIATVPISHLDIVLNSLPTDPATRNSSTFFLLGADAVLENGSAVSEVGSSLVAQVAKIHQIPMYVATESYKFARQFPIGYGTRDLERMGTRQTVLDFNAEAGEQEMEQGFDWGTKQELVDITDSALIKGLVTENGIMTPNAVAEELIKLWF